MLDAANIGLAAKNAPGGRDLSDPKLPVFDTTPTIMLPQTRGRRRHLLINLFCPKCGAKGSVCKINHKVDTKLGKLDLPYYECSACDEQWFDYGTVQGYILLTADRP